VYKLFDGEGSFLGTGKLRTPPRYQMSTDPFTFSDFQCVHSFLIPGSYHISIPLEHGQLRIPGCWSRYFKL